MSNQINRDEHTEIENMMCNVYIFIITVELNLVNQPSSIKMMIANDMCVCVCADSFGCLSVV